MSEQKPTIVCLGVPHLGKLESYFVETVLALKAPVGGSKFWVHVENRIIDDAREMIAETFMANPDATHLFFMDSDMVFPDEALRRLLSRDLDIVGGVYFARTETPVPHVYNFQRTDEQGRTWYASLAGVAAEYLKNHPEHHAAATAAVLPDSDDALTKCDALATGCMLIKRRVFDAIPQPWFENWPGSQGGEDFNFCGKARAAGFEVWADWSVQCAHEVRPTFVGRLDFMDCYAVGTPEEHDFSQPIWVEAGPQGNRVRLGPRPDDGWKYPKDVEGYLSQEAGRLLWELAKEIPEDGLCVDLGSYKGKSAICMAQTGRKVWTVDHFEGESKNVLDDKRHAKPDHVAGVYQRDLIKNLTEHGVADNVRVISRNTNDGPDFLAHHPEIDLLFVDAGHDYESVRRDLEAWEPFMTPNGTIVFDDANFTGVAQALAEAGQRGWRHIASTGGTVAVRRAYHGGN